MRYGAQAPYKGEVLEWAAYIGDDGKPHLGPHHPAALEKAGGQALKEKYPNRKSRESPQSNRFGFSTNQRPFVSRELGGKIAERSGQDLRTFEDPNEKIHSDTASAKPGGTTPISEKTEQAPPAAQTGVAQPAAQPVGLAGTTGAPPPVVEPAKAPISQPAAIVNPERARYMELASKVKDALNRGQRPDPKEFAEYQALIAQQRGPAMALRKRPAETEHDIRAILSEYIPERGLDRASLEERESIIADVGADIASLPPNQRDEALNEFKKQTEEWRERDARRMGDVTQTGADRLRVSIHNYLNRTWGQVTVTTKEGTKGPVKMRQESPSYDKWRAGFINTFGPVELEVTNLLRAQQGQPPLEAMPPEFLNEDFMMLHWNDMLDEFLGNTSKEKLYLLRRAMGMDYGKFRGVLADPDPDPILSSFLKQLTPEGTLKIDPKTGPVVTGLERFARARGMSRKEAIDYLQFKADKKAEVAMMDLIKPALKTRKEGKLTFTEAAPTKLTPGEEAKIIAERIRGERMLRAKTNKLIGEMHRRLVAYPRTPEKDPLRNKISYDDIMFESHDAEHAYKRFSDSERLNRKQLEKDLIDEAGTEKETPRVTVLVNRQTGEVDAVSTLHDHKVTYLYDPKGEPGDKTGKNIRLTGGAEQQTGAMGSHDVFATMFLRHPVRHFHQRWASLQEFMDEIGDHAEYTARSDADVQWDLFNETGKKEKETTEAEAKQQLAKAKLERKETEEVEEQERESRVEDLVKSGLDEKEARARVKEEAEYGEGEEPEATELGRFHETSDPEEIREREGTTLSEEEKMSEAMANYLRGPGSGNRGLLRLKLHSFNRGPLTTAEARSLWGFFERHKGRIGDVFDIEPIMKAIRLQADREIPGTVFKGKKVLLNVKGKPVRRGLRGRNYCFTSAMTKIARRCFNWIMGDQNVKKDIEEARHAGRKAWDLAMNRHKDEAWGLALMDVYDTIKEAREAGKDEPRSPDGQSGPEQVFRRKALEKYGDRTRSDVERSAVQMGAEPTTLLRGSRVWGPEGPGQFVAGGARPVPRTSIYWHGPEARIRPKEAPPGPRELERMGEEFMRKNPPELGPLIPAYKLRAGKAEDIAGAGFRPEDRPLGTPKELPFEKRATTGEPFEEPAARGMEQVKGQATEPGGQMLDPTIREESDPYFFRVRRNMLYEKGYMQKKMPRGSPVSAAEYGRMASREYGKGYRESGYTPTPGKVPGRVSIEGKWYKITPEGRMVKEEEGPAMAFRHGTANRYEKEMNDNGIVVIHTGGEDYVTDYSSMSPEDRVKEGKKLVLEQGWDIGDTIRKFESGEIRYKDAWKYISVIRFNDKLLAQHVEDMRNTYTENSPQWRQADKLWNMWKERRDVSLKQPWAVQGHTQQGTEDTVSGNFTLNREIAIKKKGKPLTKEEEKILKKKSRKIDEEEDHVMLIGEGAMEELENHDPEGKIAPEQEKTVEQVIAEQKSQLESNKESLKKLRKKFSQGRPGEAPTMAMSGGEPSAEPVQPLTPEEHAALTMHGSHVLSELSRQGKYSDSNWRQAMLREYGSGIGPHLDDLYNSSRVHQNEMLNQRLGLSAVNAPARKKLTRKLPTIQKCKEVVARAQRMDPVGKRISHAEASHIWSFMKQKYLNVDQNTTRKTYPEMVKDAAKELGVTKDRIHRALSTNKVLRVINRKMAEQLRVQRETLNQAKNWIYNLEYPKLVRYARWVPRAFFMAKVAGHGTVGMLTHASPLMFNPYAWKSYFKGWADMYKFTFDREFHEKRMQDIVDDPNYYMWNKARLPIDPFKFTDDYSIFKVNKALSTIFGGRGFDALKTLRLDLANHMWNKLPVHMRTQAMANLIASDVSHMTGSVSRTHLPEASNWVFFAPKLMMSQFAFLFKDPIKAMSIFARRAGGGEVSPEEMQFAMSEFKQKAAIAVTYYGFLAANQGLLKMFGSDQDINAPFMPTNDPHRSDWMQFKAFGYKVGLGGPIIQIVRFIADALKIGYGQQSRLEQLETRQDRLWQRSGEFLRGKASPFMSAAVDVATQQDFRGRPLPWSSDILPRYKRMRGESNLQWGEYVGQALLPIPMEEAFREICSEEGMDSAQTSKLIRSLVIAAGTGLTGARFSSDQFVGR
jgi:hypothetical protein